MTDDLCVQPHDSDRRALPSLRLCGSCRDHLERLIAEMPAHYDALEDSLTVSGVGGQKVSGSASEPLPVNTAVADHRHQIKHDLVWWCVYVAEERGISKPASSEPAVTATWLTVHVDWLAGNRAAAEECLPVMRQLAGRAWGLIDPDRRLSTGERCRIVDDESGERCHGTISMVQGADETWTARGAVCGPQEAAAYLHDGLSRRLVTVERVVAYCLRVHGLRVAQATVRSWALRGRIVWQTEGDRTWYDLASIQKYLTERGKMAS